MAEFRTSRKAKVERDRLLEASALPGLALDRLALAYSLFTTPTVNEPVASASPPLVWPSVEPEDGNLQELESLDDFEGSAVFRPVLEGLEGKALNEPALAERMRFHLNHGYDRLYRAFEQSGSDWEQTLVTIAPAPRPLTPTATVESARPIDISIGLDPQTRTTISWRFNTEGGAQTNANVRLAGMPGVGKSQVLMHLLASIAEKAPGVGFLLFDYKGDLHTNTDFLEATGATVLHPGEEPIPVNPFQLPPNINRNLAPRAFAELFVVVEPKLGYVQKRLITRAMEAAYEEADRSRGYPTLAEIVVAIEEVYEEAEREPDTVIAALHDLASYHCFAEESEQSHEELFSRRWVVNLAGLPVLREFVATVMLEFVHQAARSLGDAPFDEAEQVRGIRGIVALDEAHYYLRPRCQPLLDIVRTGRSKGVPVFLSSQSLEDFRRRTELNEFLPNTFVFKHGVAPDRKTLQGALRLGTSEADQVAAAVPNLEKFMGYATIARSPDGGRLRPIRLTGLWERARAARR